jgi:4-hydroxy-2-oxoheptanedioate aldolase
LDAILSIPELDGILVGPHDLSCSLEVPQRYGHRKFTEALRTIADSAASKGLICGIHFMGCGPTSRAIDWVRLGYNLVIQHADVIYVAQGLSKDLDTIRRAFAGFAGNPKS